MLIPELLISFCYHIGTTVSDQQPGGDGGSGQGYTEILNIDFVYLDTSVTGLHFDLFTKDVDGVLAFAPYSHDAEFRVPESATMLLLGFGLITLAGLKIKFRKS